MLRNKVCPSDKIMEPGFPGITLKRFLRSLFITVVFCILIAIFLTSVKFGVKKSHPNAIAPTVPPNSTDPSTINYLLVTFLMVLPPFYC